MSLQKSTSGAILKNSECFGDAGTGAANEQTGFRPKSPYGVAKTAAISLVTNYRESYGLFACLGLLFQSRIAPSATPLRDPQSDSGSGEDQRRQPGAAWLSATSRSAAIEAGLQCDQPTTSLLLRASPIRGLSRLSRFPSSAFRRSTRGFRLGDTLLQCCRARAPEP
jgi:hypothetical protein